MKIMNWRQAVLAIALLATLLAAWFAPSKVDPVVLSPHAKSVASVRPVPLPATTSAGNGQAMPQLEVQTIRLREENLETELRLFALSNPFKNGSMQEVQKVPVDVATLPPQAPPLPFQVLGRYMDEHGMAVFLRYQDRNIVARMGVTIDQTYKVELIDRTTISLRYLPMNQLQTLQLSSMN